MSTIVCRLEMNLEERLNSLTKRSFRDNSCLYELLEKSLGPALEEVTASFSSVRLWCL